MYNHVFNYLLMITWLHSRFVVGHLKDLGEMIPHNISSFTSTTLSSLHSRMKFRIVGGEAAATEEFPYAVQFFNFGGMCSGTILAKKIVLTAAHCFEFNKNIGEMRVFTRARYTFDPEATVHEVWEFKVHENFNKKGIFENDIAIVIIHDNFKFGPKVQKAYLANNDEWLSVTAKDFSVSGWGMTKYKEKTSSSDIVGHKLLKTKLNLVPKKKCEDLNNATLDPGTFCLFGDGVSDTCQGDSGGSVIWKNMVVGIVSHGYQCAVAPSMYVNVYYYRKWLHETIRNLHNKYCNFHLHEPHPHESI